jgi:hypothetical protein
VSHAADRQRPAVGAVKTVHSGVFFAVVGSIGYLLVAALRNRTDARAAVAGAVVAGEALISATSGWRCPLTGVAERLEADRASVADICLPGLVASHVPHVTVPQVGAAVVLHASNILCQTTCVARAPVGVPPGPGMAGRGWGGVW